MPQLERPCYNAGTRPNSNYAEHHVVASIPVVPRYLAVYHRRRRNSVGGHCYRRLEAIAIRLEAIAIRLEAIAIRLEAIAIRLEAIAIRLEAIAIRLEAIAIRLEAIAIRLEAIAIRLEAIAIRLEAIAIRLEAIARWLLTAFLLCSLTRLPTPGGPWRAKR